MLFNPFRYFIIPSKNNIEHHYGKYSIENKELLANDILSELTKERVEYRNSNYLIYKISEYDDRYLLLKVAREKEQELHQEGEHDIDDIIMDDYPYVYVILDKKKQIFLIHHDRNVFANTSICSNILEKFFNSYTSKYDYEIIVNPMLIEDEFWKSISKMERIKEAKFELESPNIFEGIISTNKFLKKIAKRYNNTSVQFKLKNKYDSLIIENQNEELKDTVTYISNGGGKWKVIGFKNSKKIEAESSKHLQKITTDKDIQELFKNKDKEAIKIFSKVQDVIDDTDE